jgi:hypothetical protein
VRGLSAPLLLIAARARRGPRRWTLPVLGLALATAFAATVAAEGTIAGDQAARSVLTALSPLQRTVRVTWQGPLTPGVSSAARRLLRGLRLGAQTQVALLNPVRLGGVVVLPAAIEPLDRWVSGSGLRGSVPQLGPCRATACPVLLAGGPVRRRTLSAAGVRLQIIAGAHLRSAAPLSFLPGATSDEPPLVITGDVTGLDTLAGLNGVYRTHSWLALLPVSALNSWQLAASEQHLAQAQAQLLQSGSQFSLSAPFAALDAARAQASAAPARLLLAGGGALAALAGFIVLSAFGLRRDQHAELQRLLSAGARMSQCLTFVFGEAAALSALALLTGAALAVASTAVHAGAAGVPAGGVLSHSLLTGVGAAVLAGAWVAVTVAIGLVLRLRDARAADVLAVAAVAALALALTRGDSGSDPLPVLLAPLCAAAAGVLVFRGCSALLRGAERLFRRGPLVVRLALVSLTRAPAAPSLAVAFVAVSVGLGGFTLAYRATLVRGSADQAADQVPLDATISPTADFDSPLGMAPLAQWRSLSGGEVLPVRRTQATYASDAATVTVPALGVPAAGLTQIHGWRTGDGSAPIAVLAARLTPPGPSRIPGPLLPAGTRSLSLRLGPAAIAVVVTADLRDGSGAIRQVTLGAAGARAHTVHAGIPRRRTPWELEALELDEPAGLELTNGHQNGENPAAATQFGATLSLGPLLARGAADSAPTLLRLTGWRGIGAAGTIGSAAGSGAGSRAGPGPGGLRVRFAPSGLPGLLRPRQPSDVRPVPVLVDPGTAAAAARAGDVALTVDGLPVAARVVGVLARFPTLSPDDAGFVVADEATLASALDAQLPGQGRPDELWVATRTPGRLRAALARGPLANLGASFRIAIERRLRSAPIARAVLATLVAATALAGGLALLGLVVALLGAGRDVRVERDLIAQGLGPSALRRELRVRLVLAGIVGVAAGLVLAVALTRLAVVSVRAAATLAAPRPALVTVAPWGELALGAVIAVLALSATSILATAAFVQRRGAG